LREVFSKIPENVSVEERLQYFPGKGLVDGQIVFRGRKTQCLQLRDQLNIDLGYRDRERGYYNLRGQIMDEEIVKAGGTLAQDWVEQQTSDPIERWVLKKIDRLDGSYRRHMTPEEIQAAMRLTTAGVLKKQEMPQFQALERWVKDAKE
jgi:hypothetical protein